jgi:hypothetical protein
MFLVFLFIYDPNQKSQYTMLLLKSTYFQFFVFYIFQ